MGTTMAAQPSKKILSEILNPEKIGDSAFQLQDHLCRTVVGQREAIDAVVDTFQTYLAKLNPQCRPIGSFLLLGPTGVGKTHLVECVAEALLKDRHAVLKVDCAEFQHSHEIAKLIGSPPGYLGHKETHPMLSQSELAKSYTESLKIAIVLFDEIEKANDSLWNLLLGILDKAQLTTGDNHKVDFTDTMIFMTSNLGAREMSDLGEQKVGFSGTKKEESRKDSVVRVGVEAAKRNFTPEFMNRLDKVAVFHPLGEEEFAQVLELELLDVQKRIIEAEEVFILQVEDEVKGWLLEEGVSRRYGARNLKRVIEKRIVRPLANLIVSKQVVMGDTVVVRLKKGEGEKEFEFSKTKGGRQ